MTSQLPVAIIGAGPIGLAAAAHLIGRGLDVLIFERADDVAASQRAWGHVRLFSPWRYTPGRLLLAPLQSVLADGWRLPVNLLAQACALMIVAFSGGALQVFGVSVLGVIPFWRCVGSARGRQPHRTRAGAAHHRTHAQRRRLRGCAGRRRAAAWCRRSGLRHRRPRPSPALGPVITFSGYE